MTQVRTTTVMPSAARLTDSLRDIGYDFWSAVADVVDNSIVAQATSVDISIEIDGPEARVIIADDGEGMGPGGVIEALRFGSRRAYLDGELGRFGLGLKTASLSQCRSVTVASRRSRGVRVCLLQLDLDLIEESDEWVVRVPLTTSVTSRARALLKERPGTVVVWENLDRVGSPSSSGWARRRIESLTTRTAQHLSMVFHRYLDSDHPARNVTIVVNGQKLAPWDPFARNENATEALAPIAFEIGDGDQTGVVRLDRFVLPARERFSSGEEFERMSGPLKWNRQQGLYLYRADRLIQWGGWSGIRAIDEHTKLARAAISFETSLDRLFNINVAKMRATVPAQLRPMLERPIQELCLVAGDAYRGGSDHRGRRRRNTGPNGTPVQGAAAAGLALRSAALQSGDYAALKRIAAILQEQAPDFVEQLGLGDL